MKKRVAIPLMSLLLFTLGGCSVTSEYQRPQLAVPGTFDDPYTTPQTAAETGSLLPAAASLGWRDVFTDPVLQELIASALANNRDLRETALNVEVYQAQYRIQRAGQFPSVSADGYGRKQRTISGETSTTSETYSLSLGMTSYELDLYGRIASMKEQALEQYLSREEGRKSAAITLISEVARTYLTWLADRELLETTEETLQVEEESHALVHQRVEAGVANELELAQARTSLETARANLALYRRQVAQDYHYLALLTGAQLPQDLESRTVLLSDVTLPALLPWSLSSEVLLTRPDIMAAEHELMGANANIGAARAAFFPTISLTANGGVMSSELGGLFDGSSGTWLFSPAISLPIFNAGRLQAELDTAELSRDISIARYEKAIQTAFQEVSDALVAVDTYREQLEAQQANLAANEVYFSRARDRYKEGVDSFLTLLDAQRSLYSSRQSFLTLKLARLENLVTLYKVLGGGAREYTDEEMIEKSMRNAG